MTEEMIYALMMDALDGELDERGHADLAVYLADRPDLAREWNAMQLVDTLLRETPPVPVPVNFAERTLQRLPNPRYRRAILLMFYVALLVGGLAPILGLAWLYTQFGGGDALAFAGQSVVQLFSVLRALLGAIYATATALLFEQPLIFGWLFLMLGIIGTWYSVYQQFANQMVPMPLGSARRLSRS